MTHTGFTPTHRQPAPPQPADGAHTSPLTTDDSLRASNTPHHDMTKALTAVNRAVEICQSLLTSDALWAETSVPCHELVSRLDEACLMIDQARAAIGDPEDGVPILRLPAAERELRSDRLGLVGDPIVGNAMPSASGVADIPGSPDTVPMNRPPRSSCDRCIQQAIGHLDRAATYLGAEAEEVACEPAPATLQRCNQDLKQAQHYLHGAKQGVLMRRPGEDPRPPPPPIFGGQDDLVPKFDRLFP